MNDTSLQYWLPLWQSIIKCESSKNVIVVRSSGRGSSMLNKDVYIVRPDGVDISVSLRSSHTYNSGYYELLIRVYKQRLIRIRWDIRKFDKFVTVKKPSFRNRDIRYFKNYASDDAIESNFIEYKKCKLDIDEIVLSTILMLS